jgi:hypothetical protein
MARQENGIHKYVAHTISGCTASALASSASMAHPVSTVAAAESLKSYRELLQTTDKSSGSMGDAFASLQSLRRLHAARLRRK